MSDGQGEDGGRPASTRPRAALVARHARLLREEQVRLLYASSGIALVTTPLASVTVAIVGAGQVPAGLLVAWLAYVMAVAGARALMVWRFRQARAAALDVDVWHRRFVIGAACAGAGWG